MYYLKQPKKCPSCSLKAGAKIFWGMPSYIDLEMQQAIDKGTLVLGGCCMPMPTPQYRCGNCQHEWSNKKHLVMGEVHSVYDFINMDLIFESTEKSPSNQVYCTKMEGLCNKTWDELDTTNSSDKRYCNSCRKNVWQITSSEALEKIRDTSKNVCIAYFPNT